MARQKRVRRNAASRSFREHPETQRVLSAMASSYIVMGEVLLPEMAEVESAAFHYEIENDLLSLDPSRTSGFEHDLFNYIAPRGHAKSSHIALLFPLWHLFCEDRYLFENGLISEDRVGQRRKFVVIQSKTLKEAIRRLTTIKNVLEYSEDFQRYFGYHGQFVCKKWREDEIELPNGDLIIAIGTNQQARGLKHGHQRVTLFVLDDPEDEENSKNPERLQSNMDKLLKGLEPARDASRGRGVVIGTPIVQRSMVLELMKIPTWRCRHYSCYVTDETTGEVTALWPQLWPLDKLKEKEESLRSVGRLSVFFSEYVCQIIGDEEQPFREEDLRYYEGTLVYEGGYHYLDVTYKGTAQVATKSEVKRIPVAVFMGVDPASSTSQRADYSSIVVVAVDKDYNVYVVDAWRDRQQPLDVAKSIIDRFQRYHPLKSKIEATGYQEMLRQFLLQSGVFIPGLEIKEMPRSAKSTRLESLQPYFAQHRFYVRCGMKAYVDEFLAYPRGRNDDQMDATYYALKGSYKPYHTDGSAPRRTLGRNRKGSWMSV